MILNYAKGPFIKNVPTIPSMMRDVIFTLSVLLIIPIVQYGVRPLVMAVCTMFVSVICEIIFNLIQGNKIGAGDGSSLVTGLMIVMLMPVNAPIWLPCMAAVFAVIVAKMPFGAFGHTPFNPAAAGVAFAALCYPHLVFRYIDSSAKNLPAFGDCTGDIVSSTAAVLKNGLKPSILPLDMLWGAFEGPLGTTGILIICAGGLYLFIKRTANWEITAAFLAAALINRELRSLAWAGISIEANIKIKIVAIRIIIVFITNHPLVKKCALLVMNSTIDFKFLHIILGC